MPDQNPHRRISHVQAHPLPLRFAHPNPAAGVTEGRISVAIVPGADQVKWVRAGLLYGFSRYTRLICDVFSLEPDGAVGHGLSVLAYVVVTKAEPLEVTNRGMTLSTLAGALGALGALGIVFALLYGGRPIFVAPIVFAGAPIVNTIVSMIWHKPASAPNPLFFAGIVLAAVGASMVLRFRPI